MRRWFCFLDKDKMPTHRNTVRLAGIPALKALLLFTAVAPIGCDSNSFVPPRPEELRGTGTTTLAPLKNASSDPAGLDFASARAVEIVLAPRDGDEAEVWKSAARTQSGHEKIKVKVTIAAADQPTSKQMELVREAMARHPRVLVVEPADPSDSALAQAVAETRAQGIPVVLLGRPLTGDNKTPATPSTSSTGPLVVVAPPPFSSSARELVAAAIRNANAAELDPNGGAIIVINTLGDQFIPDRVAGIRDALKTAGITSVEEIRFAGDVTNGENLVKDGVKAHPKATLIFTVDYMSTSAMRGLMNSTANSPIFVAGCYTSDANMHDISMQMAVAAAVDFTPVRLLRKAIATAASLAQGKVISSPAELTVAVEDRPGHAASLRAAVANAKKPADAKSGTAKE
jgi:ABC-type sugar transport system substrate-binding protein